MTDNDEKTSFIVLGSFTSVKVFEGYMRIYYTYDHTHSCNIYSTIFGDDKTEIIMLLFFSRHYYLHFYIFTILKTIL